MLDTVKAMECGWEWGDRPNGKDYAIDVPPEVDIDAVYDLLNEGLQAGHWDCQAGYIGHPEVNDQNSSVV